LVIFKIEIYKVKRMDLTDSQAELIHQGIDGLRAVPWYVDKSIHSC
jgi:hypothetical protein